MSEPVTRPSYDFDGGPIKRCRFCNGPTRPFQTMTVLYDLCLECGEKIPVAEPVRSRHIDLNSVEISGGK